MTTHRDSNAANTDRATAATHVTRSIAWGRTIITVLVGAALGSTYSLVNRPVTAAPPAQVAMNAVALAAEDMTVSDALVPDRPVVMVADMLMLPLPPSKSLRDVSVQPQVAEVPSTFQSIATLSAPSPRMEAEVRALKGKPSTVTEDDAASRGTGKVDAVAAVWGFLAVGLGGSTATAATMRSAKQPR